MPEDDIAAYALAIIDDLDAVREQIGTNPGAVAERGFPPLDAALGTRAIVGARADIDADLADRTEAIIGEQRERLLGAGVEAVDKLRSDGPRATLNGAQRVGLEAIVVAARPALVLTDGVFEQPAPPWDTILEPYSDSIAAAAASVGRVETTNLSPGTSYAGTAFLVADDVVMTNRHVAIKFAAGGADLAWSFLPGAGASVAFADDPARDHATGDRLPGPDVVEVIGVHDRLDLALLKLDGKPPGTPLALMGDAPEGMTGRRIYVVGYPAPDLSYSIVTTHAVFGDKYGVRRLQPGGVMEVPVDRVVAVEPSALGTRDDDVFFHDASTLGGNSGSCIVDLESNTVLGLHYAGLAFRYNVGVALWRLAEDPLLTGAGVTFD